MKRVFQAATWTPTAAADNTTLANGTYMAIGASGAAAGCLVSEIFEGGQATASAVNIMVFARDVVLGATPTALATPNSDGPLNSFASALSANALTFVAALTGPSRITAATGAKLNLSFNAFGGICKWLAPQGGEWGILGVGTSVSESSLSAFTGGNVGLMGAHLVYEIL